MKLSVIIVNYNVRHFLELTLESLLQSITTFDFEIIVVDNSSSDNSVSFVQSNYPSIKLVVLEENLGFAKANNLAAKIAKGEYLLLLNPDTIIDEDTLQKSVEFLESKDNAGAIGVKMFDGAGNYLPESKRGFPGPWISFCKLTGLNQLFPRSKYFNYYYLGHLSENESQSVDVLTGAFMLLNRNMYLDVGGLDEQFFMYGEDIDLCYRLNESGKQNYYFAGTNIIHFKGESTRKRSYKYIRTFYKAMSIYAQKHYAKSYYRFFNPFIQFAIYSRAALGYMYRFFSNHSLYLGSIIFGIIGIFAFIKYAVFSNMLAFLGVWTLIGSYFQVFEKQDFRWWDHFQAALWSSLSFFILSLFGISAFELSLIPIVYFLLIFGLHWAWKGNAVFLPRNELNTSMLAKVDLKNVKVFSQVANYFMPTPKIVYSTSKIVEKTNGLAFDNAAIRYADIIDEVIDKKSQNQRFHIFSTKSKTLINSYSKAKSGLILNHDSYTKALLQRQLYAKRRVDLRICLYFLFTGKVFSSACSWNQWIAVFLGRMTWVGDDFLVQNNIYNKPYVFPITNSKNSEQVYEYLNAYSFKIDLKIIFRNISEPT